MRAVVALLTLAALQGCSGIPSGQDPRDAAATIARRGALEPATEIAGGFRLLTYRRGLAAGTGPVSVYIEGDGRAWRGRRPPRDPTPFHPMGLSLAARDPGAAVLWIARPCMYGRETDAMYCDRSWWTSHRYASEVVEALDEIISRAVPAERGVVLVGHSGGGVLATLLAARRQDVRGLLTVTSPLDLEAWVEHHRITPLHGSLDPVAVAHLLGDLPQRHLTGGADRVVPPFIVRSFLRALPQPNRARIEVLPEETHRCCWEERWPVLRGQDW